MSHQQDLLLIQRLNDGDQKAFDELYLKYYKLLCASAFFLLKNQNEAKDIVQTFFLDILEKELFRSFHGEIKGYLFVAIKHRCLNRIKSQKLDEARQRSYGILQDGEEMNDMEGKLSGYHHQLAILLNKMKGQKRVAVEMVYMQDKKYKDAAKAMGISINSFKTHLKSALKTLRDNMDMKTN